jgi:serine/threonine protein kinase
LTEMGQSLGTFSFMPPEQIGKAKTVDHRADIYACTTLIYQSLTGQLPYIAKNVLVMVELKAKQPPRTVAEALNGPVDPRLESFISKGLARDANERFQTAGDALAAWRELVQRVSNPARMMSPAPTPPPAWQQSSSVLPVVRPSPPVDILTRNDLRPNVPVIYNDSTMDDVVATVAMPRARLLQAVPAAANRGPTTPPASSYVADARTASTTPLPAPMHQGGYSGASGSGTYGVAQPPTGTPVAFAHPSGSQPGYSGGPQSPNMGGYPGWPGNAPPNPGQWRQQTGPNMPAVEPTLPEVPQQRPIPFFFWGILAALLGFAIVGVVLYLTRS